MAAPGQPPLWKDLGVEDLYGFIGVTSKATDKEVSLVDNLCFVE